MSPEALRSQNLPVLRAGKKTQMRFMSRTLVSNLMGGNRIRDSLNICASAPPGGSQSKLVTARDVHIQFSAR
jgi:hypothetical protein